MQKRGISQIPQHLIWFYASEGHQNTPFQENVSPGHRSFYFLDRFKEKGGGGTDKKMNGPLAGYKTFRRKFKPNFNNFRASRGLQFQAIGRGVIMIKNPNRNFLDIRWDKLIQIRQFLKGVNIFRIIDHIMIIV